MMITCKKDVESYVTDVETKKEKKQVQLTMTMTMLIMETRRDETGGLLLAD